MGRVYRVCVQAENGLAPERYNSKKTAFHASVRRNSAHPLGQPQNLYYPVNAWHSNMCRPRTSHQENIISHDTDLSHFIGGVWFEVMARFASGLSQTIHGNSGKHIAPASD